MCGFRVIYMEKLKLFRISCNPWNELEKADIETLILILKMNLSRNIVHQFIGNISSLRIMIKQKVRTYVQQFDTLHPVLNWKFYKID